ncbi:MAG: flagellar hook-length control protein FliK [Salinarimonas sp.]
MKGAAGQPGAAPSAGTGAAQPTTAQPGATPGPQPEPAPSQGQAQAQAQAQVQPQPQPQALPQAQAGQPQIQVPQPAPPPAPLPGAPQPPVFGNVPLGAVPIEIGMRSLGNLNRFTIRLDPVELGRIDVSLEIEEGEVTARLQVERPETLLLLQRDAKALERAFEQAGLKTNESSVQMSLRQDEGRGDGQAGARGEAAFADRDGRDGRGRRDGDGRGGGPPEPRALEALAPRRLLAGGLVGIDMRI